MANSYITPIGVFSDGSSYRAALIGKGYKDLGWQNSWRNDSIADRLWDHLPDNEHVESFQWNRSGSDCTRVLHESRNFSSVDMGD